MGVPLAYEKSLNVCLQLYSIFDFSVIKRNFLVFLNVITTNAE